MAATDTPPGQRLSFWIGQAARQVREESGFSLEAVAVRLGRGKEMVDRFEKGRTRPHELERLLAAYAEAANLGDPREIPVRAIRLWYEHGEPPSLNGTPE